MVVAHGSSWHLADIGADTELSAEWGKAVANFRSNFR
jgi:hypothetical protein